MCYDGAFRKPKHVSCTEPEATEPAPASYYGVCSQEGAETRHESSDNAEEVLFSLLSKSLTWKQRKGYKEKKTEDCAWTPVVKTF